MTVLMLFLGLVLPPSFLQAQSMQRGSVGKRSAGTTASLPATKLMPKKTDSARIKKVDIAESPLTRRSDPTRRDPKYLPVNDDVVRLPDSRLPKEEPARPKAVLKKVVF